MPEDIADQLRHLMQLRDDGVLSENEFERAKARVLRTTGETPAPPPEQGPEKKKSRFPILATIVGLVLLLILIGAINGDTGDDGGTTESPSVDPPRSDPGPGYQIETNNCTQDQFTKSYTGTITNTTDSTQSYWITVIFTAAGTRVDDGLAIINDLAPGQTATWEAQGFGDSSFDQCEVQSVDVFDF